VKVCFQEFLLPLIYNNAYDPWITQVGDLVSAKSFRSWTCTLQ